MHVKLDDHDGGKNKSEFNFYNCFVCSVYYAGKKDIVAGFPGAEALDLWTLDLGRNFTLFEDWMSVLGSGHNAQFP